MRRLLHAIAATALATVGAAQEPAIVRAALAGPERPWVGQRVGMDVKLLVPTRFGGVPSFDLPTVDDALLMRIGGGNSRALLGSERIGGETYVSALYRFAAFFQEPGSFTIPPFEVRFQSVDSFGAEPTPHALMTEALTVEVVAPPGTERLAYVVSTTQLDVSDEWDRELEGLRVGDAVTRTITMSAPDVPGLLLPAIPVENVTGLEPYPKDPVVDTRTQRGEFAGQRVDRVTYVCAEEGIAEVPALRIRWWNVETETLESIVLDGAKFAVSPAPQREEAPAEGEAEEAKSAGAADAPSPWTVLGVAALLAAAIALWPRIKRWARARRREWDASERGRFTVLVTALARNDARRSLRALYAWIDVALAGSSENGVATIETLAGIVGDPELDRELDALQEAAIAGSSRSGAKLAALLRRARHDHERAFQLVRPPALPPLNPRVGPADSRAR